MNNVSSRNSFEIRRLLFTYKHNSKNVLPKWTHLKNNMNQWSLENGDIIDRGSFNSFQRNKETFLMKKNCSSIFSRCFWDFPFYFCLKNNFNCNRVNYLLIKMLWNVCSNLAVLSNVSNLTLSMTATWHLDSLICSGSTFTSFFHILFCQSSRNRAKQCTLVSTEAKKIEIKLDSTAVISYSNVVFLLQGISQT